MSSPVDPTVIITWPQASVAIVIILAILVWPGVLAWLNTRSSRATNDAVKKTLTENNGGSSIKDYMDRNEAANAQILAKLDDHSERLQRLEHPEEE